MLSSNSEPSPSDPVRKAQPTFSDWYFARRYSVLFLSLMVTLILAPVSEEYRLPGWPVELLYLMNLTAAAVGLDSSRGRRRAYGRRHFNRCFQNSGPVV